MTSEFPVMAVGDESMPNDVADAVFLEQVATEGKRLLADSRAFNGISVETMRKYGPSPFDTVRVYAEKLEKELSEGIESVKQAERISFLEGRVASLNADVDELSNLLSEKHEQIRDILDKKAGLEEELSSVRSSSERRFRAHEGEISDLRDEVDFLGLDVKALIQTIKILSRREDK